MRARWTPLAPRYLAAPPRSVGNWRLNRRVSEAQRDRAMRDTIDRLREGYWVPVLFPLPRRYDSRNMRLTCYVPLHHRQRLCQGVGGWETVGAPAWEKGAHHAGPFPSSLHGSSTGTRGPLLHLGQREKHRCHLAQRGSAIPRSSLARSVRRDWGLSRRNGIKSTSAFSAWIVLYYEGQTGVGLRVP